MVIRRLTAADKDAIASLFLDIQSEETNFFHPHSFDSETVNFLATYDGDDLYLGLFLNGNKLVGYGMLRGYDEAFSIPSLGIYIHSRERGKGLAKLLMERLHHEASLRGAERIRLTVDAENLVARKLYENCGYSFTAEGNTLIGYLKLEKILKVGGGEVIYPVYQPFLSGNERKYVLDCLDSGWISSRGSYVESFEREFARYLGVEDAIAVANGTVALHLALLGIGIQAGDEVLVQTFTYIASVNAIAYCGAKPVFVDSNPDDWQIDIKAIEASITPKTKAILVAHLYGGSTNILQLKQLAKRLGLSLIEDCAESLGSKFNQEHLGTFGDVSTFSFFGNKTITTGEGGMVVARDPKVTETIRLLKGQGLSHGREYWHEVIGYNYRMTNICAAIGLAQLEKVEVIVAEKQRISAEYRKNLSDLDVDFPSTPPTLTVCEWMISIVVRQDLRDPLRMHLKSRGVETRPFFYPAHQMPMYVRPNAHFEVADNISKSGLNLPSYPGLKNSDISIICNEIRKFLLGTEYSR